jgi:hypothetical protein
MRLPSMRLTLVRSAGVACGLVLSLATTAALPAGIAQAAGRLQQNPTATVQTWRTQRAYGADFGSSNGELPVSSLSCPTSTDCMAVGETSAGYGAAAATSNGGATWVYRALPEGTGDLLSVSCPETGDCWAVASAGTIGIIVTSNAGASWVPQTVPADVYGE